jgi:hypothetical protein
MLTSLPSPPTPPPFSQYCQIWLDVLKERKQEVEDAVAIRRANSE